jgi:hypothetical protein
MSTPIIIGEDAATPQASKEQSLTLQGVTTRISFRGPTARCLAMRPVPGSQWAGYPGYVTSSTVTTDETGVATLAIEIGASPGDGSDGGSSIDETNYSVEMLQVEKALEKNPMYNERTQFGPARMDAKVTYLKSHAIYADAVWEKLFGDAESATITLGQACKTARDATPDERRLLSSPNATEDGELNPMVNEAMLIESYLSKWDKGIESYTVHTPVVRLTLKRNTPPNLGRIDGRDTPPLPSSLLPQRPDGSSYVWIKTNASYSWTGRNGLIEAVQEWTGVDEADNDLYPP